MTTSRRQVVRGLEKLEDRKPLTVTVTPDAGGVAGTLEVSSNNDGDNVVVYDLDGYVMVDEDGNNVWSGQPAKNNLAITAVKILNVYGTGGTDTLNVSAVDSDWTNIKHVTCKGGANNDSIWGSQLGDWLEGEDGSDTVRGRGGNDNILGDGLAGDDAAGDLIFGDDGNDPYLVLK